MAGLMQRASLIVKAKFSNLLNRAESPTETLDYSYEQMLQQLQNVKRGVADVVTAKKRLEIQTQQIEQNVVKLETQARQAVGAGREDLARQALERKAAAQQQLQGLDQQVQQLGGQQEKLIASQQRLESRIESFRSQKEVIKAQYSAEAKPRNRSNGARATLRNSKTVGLRDIRSGRAKLKGPADDRLFALTTAVVTLDVECGLKPAGAGAVIFKPLSAGEFAQV